MPRDRQSKKDRWLPTRVYRARKNYEWHPKGGGSITLCPLDATRAQVWEAYEKVAAKHAGKGISTVEQLKDDYFRSPWFLKLKPGTQDDYHDYWKNLGPVFGKMDCRRVLPKHVRQYMDLRGQTAPIMANRERVLLKNIMGHAYQQSLIDVNPCDGVRPFPEKARDNYVPDDEYWDFFDASRPVIQVLMELAYVNAARGQDVRRITLQDLRDIGIYIRQQKTGKQQIKRWNARLQAAVDLAMEIRKPILERLHIDSPYLIITRGGTPYSAEGLKSIWQKNKAAVLKATGLKINWTYHDLKAKGISDYEEGDKQAFSGHKSHSMMERYNRSPDVVTAIDFRKDRLKY